jgi:hypothetical protein
VTVYLVALATLMLAALAGAFAAPESLLGCLRFIPIFAVYPLFLVMAATEGVGTAGLCWGALTTFGLALLLVTQAGLPRAERAPLLGAVWKTALLWPLVVPAATDGLLIRLGIVPPPAEPRLPEPPRGSELIALSDDAMLVAVHQILSGHADLTAEERLILAAETFNREVHGGGFGQWFSNTESSVTDTIGALRAVGADGTARLLERAAGAVPAGWSEMQPLDTRIRLLEPMKAVLRSLDDSFFALEREEDLTALIARFVRQNRTQCPALA